MSSSFLSTNAINKVNNIYKQNLQDCNMDPMFHIVTNLFCVKYLLSHNQWHDEINIFIEHNNLGQTANKLKDQNSE